MDPKKLHPDIERLIDLALREDISAGDITTELFVPRQKTSRAYMVTHEKATIVGAQIVKRIFQKLDPGIKVRCAFKDGDIMPANKRIVEINGKTRTILLGERVALNFISHLSAIATNTTAFLKEVRPYSAQIVDTRKTTPGFRVAEKYAIRCAKGVNHRMNLNDMILIKDNHHLISHLSIIDMMKKAKQRTKKPIGVEVETFQDFQEAWEANPDLILLDNMSPGQIKKIIDFTKKDQRKRVPMLEVSGGVNLDNVRSFAKTGIERISIGALTHTKKSVNISMEIVI